MRLSRQSRRVVSVTGMTLTLATLAIWVGSRWWWYGGSISTTGVAVVIVAGRLDVIVSNSAIPVHAPGWKGIERHSLKFGWWFHFARSSNRLAASSTRFATPLWALALLTALAPLAVRWSSWRARRLGLCTECLYDLRGSCTGVCPECGGHQSKVDSA